MAFITYGIYNIVRNLQDFPVPVAGVITLPNNTTWILINSVDIGVNRIACQTVTIQGTNSRAVTLTNNNAAALITSTGNVFINNIALHNAGADSIFALNGTGITGISRVVLTNILLDAERIGTIQNYSSIYFERCAFTNIVASLVIDGTVGSFTAESCIFSTTAAITEISFPATLTITSRIQFFLCRIQVDNAGATGINLNVAAVINSESYVAFFNSFLGVGTALAGVLPTDNKGFFKNNRGITNSAFTGQLFMNNNATATTNPGINTFAKAAGTTTAGDLERFTMPLNNRLLLNASVSQRFYVSVIGSFTVSAGNECSFRIAKNGTTIAASENKITGSGAGTNISFTLQVSTSMVLNDFIEVFCANNSSGGNNITVAYLNIVINAIS